ncbi:MAG: hypothetical protein L3J28_03550 [Candidatus Polarisedimenticolaceae bacterium]|nr:hypothetical protein [Candidatus Polarisedimenticolaceae bacterium]
MKTINLITTGLLLSLALAQPTSARNFRDMIRIPVAPERMAVEASATLTSFSPVDRATIEKSIRKIVASWNGPDLAKYLAKNFQDKHLLLTTIQRSVPMDAKLRLISVHGISTLEQNNSLHPTTHARQRRSVVIATVDLQLEFNDPFKGLVKLPHSSQFYLQVVESE